MSTYRYIYWRDDFKPRKGKCFANVHYLVGYCPQSIEAYADMAKELRKTFPDATDSEINCHQVTKSSYCDRFTLITYNAYLERKEYPGWEARNSPQYNY